MSALPEISWLEARHPVGGVNLAAFYAASSETKKARAKRSMKKHNLLLIGMVAALPVVANAGIVGSPHDFSQQTWNTRKGVCTPCHQAHNTDPDQLAPLWAHATSQATFTMYNAGTPKSTTLDATMGTRPDGASLACLSCHDGTVAVNQGIAGQIGATSQYIESGGQIGPDLHTTHPISFVYDKALADKDGFLLDPTPVTGYKIGDTIPQLPGVVAPVPTSWSGSSMTGRTIGEALLINQKMQCSSCHDVHKQEGSSATSGIMAKISGSDSSGRGSLLCRNCHIK